MNAVETTDLSKTYRTGVFKKKNIVALEKVSLTVAPGEIFGLLGPNGAGKTTFVKLLLSIVHPTGGSATVLGEPLDSIAIREQCGYLPENHRYPGYLNGTDTLMFFGRLNGISDAVLRSRAGSLMELVGLKDWGKVKIKRYSKGMLQRLGLAQALINEPKILFLDEPTDGVDPIGRKEIRDILVTLKSRGVTIFLNSHLLSEVELMCDRVAILNKGSVIKVGRIEELTRREPFYHIQLTLPLSETVHAALAARAFEFSVQDREVILRTNDASRVNEFIDLLRSHGLTIEGMHQQKATLEESFINLIQGTGA